MPPGRIAHDYQEGKAPLLWLSFSLRSSKMNFLWQTVYFASELKWFIGCWKIASWNLFLNILLYKLSSHIWCFPGTHSKAEGSVSLCWGWNWDAVWSSSQLTNGRVPRASWRWAQAGGRWSLICKSVWPEPVQQQREKKGSCLCFLPLSSSLPVQTQKEPFSALCFVRKNLNYLEWLA